MRINCFGCGQPVSTEVPDGTVFRGTAECPECCEAKPDPDAIVDRYRRKVQSIQEVALSIFTQGLAMFDEGVSHWHESETSLSAHEWLGLSPEEYGMWMTMRPPKGLPVYKAALEEIQRVLSGTVTVAKPLTQVVSEIVERALKED